MKKIMSVCLFVLLLSYCSLHCENNLEFSLEPAVNSKYVWRGITCSDFPVFQPSASVAYNSLSFNLWANLNLENKDSYDMELNEIDYTINYQALSGPLELDLGCLFYTFPNTTASATTELYISAGLPWKHINPSLTIFQDVDEAEGTYASIGVNPSIPFESWNTSLDLALRIGLGSAKHNAFYYGADSGGATDLLLEIAMPFALSENASITPHIGFTSLLDREIRASQARDNTILVGIGFSTSF